MLLRPTPVDRSFASLALHRVSPVSYCYGRWKL
jgi:hypothetical protein